MTHPTNDELEAMAVQLEDRCDWENNSQFNIVIKAAALRALEQGEG